MLALVLVIVVSLGYFRVRVRDNFRFSVRVSSKVSATLLVLG